MIKLKVCCKKVACYYAKYDISATCNEQQWPVNIGPIATII